MQRGCSGLSCTKEAARCAWPPLRPPIWPVRVRVRVRTSETVHPSGWLPGGTQNVQQPECTSRVHGAPGHPCVHCAPRANPNPSPIPNARCAWPPTCVHIHAGAWRRSDRPQGRALTSREPYTLTLALTLAPSLTLALTLTLSGRPQGRALTSREPVTSPIAIRGHMALALALAL